MSTDTQRISLFFPKCESEKPIVYHLVRDFDLEINIFRAKVTPDDEGYMILDVTGEADNVKRGMEYLSTFNITISGNQKGLAYIRENCAQCGSCIPHCPTEALSIPDRNSMEIRFNPERCIECMSCVQVCPFGACRNMF